MRRNILFLIASLCITALQAQVNVDDFEAGSNTGWTSVSSMGYVDVRANEYKTGINLSDYVLFCQRAAADDDWAGALRTPYVQSGYKYLHAYMFRSNDGTPNLKVSDSNARDLEPMNAVVAGQWQDVVFDISDYEQSGIEFLFFMVDRGALTELTWMLVDEIQLSNDPAPRTAVVGEDNTPSDEYNMVWNEDFTDSSLDLNVWNIEVNGDGGGNNELQYYCEKGVSLGADPATGKRCLILTAAKESYNGKDCTSGRVNTKGKMTYTYGKIEARIKFPDTANGLWPAFWQLGNNIDEVGWPRCGETDIIELGHKDGFNNRQNRYFNGAMHVGSAWNTVWQDVNAVEWPYAVEDTFHILTMIWTPQSIEMYMDKDAHPENNAYFYAKLESNDNPDYDRSIVFGKPNFVVANLAVGGNFPGIFNINGISALANGPRSMYIDWIRIYQRGDANQSFVCSSPSDAIEPSPAMGFEQYGIGDGNQKILHQGQIFIRRGEHIYTITGQLVE